MIPDSVHVFAVYLGIVRDIVFLLTLTLVVVVVFLLYRKLSKTIGSVGNIVEDGEKVVSVVSATIVGSLLSKSSLAGILGKVASFLDGSEKRESTD